MAGILPPKFPGSSFGQEFRLYYTIITGLKGPDGSETMGTDQH